MKTCKISIIAAVGNNWELGYKNQLLCHLPEDLKHFKKITTGHPVIMGENTYNSLPIKPLPDRQNIVMTLDNNAIFNNCNIAHSLQKAIDLIPKNEEAFVIGGASIYKQFLEISDKIFLTKILSDFKADVFFPVLDSNEWKLESETLFRKDEKNQFDMKFQYFVRK